MKTLGVVLFPHFELLDVFGPLEMFGQLPDKIKVVLLAEQGSAVASYQGAKVEVDANFSNAPAIDLLFVPGGLGTRQEVENKNLLNWLRQCAVHAELIISVCTGAALLAKAGILDNRRATSNKKAFDWVVSQGPKVNWISQARWVEDGNVVTSSGVAAGIDMSLQVISRLYGKETALQIAKTTEYIWNEDPHHDPFTTKTLSI